MTDWLEPREMDLLSGEERFGETDLSVGDFWKWSSNDLRENVTRGILAEFLVAKAVGDTCETRSAWADYDVTSAEGTKIEVKSSAYLQSWRQKEPSKIVFSGLRSRSYSYETNAMSEESEYSAEVYVFAVQTCTEPTEYDPLDISSWEFYVIPVSYLIELGSPKAISKSRLDGLGAKTVPYRELASAVKTAGEVAVPEVAAPATAERVAYGENWDEGKFKEALEKRYEGQQEMAKRMIAFYEGLLEAGAELNPGGTEEDPSATLWLNRGTELAVSASVYTTGISINFGWALKYRSPEEMQRLDDLVCALPGASSAYGHLAENRWEGKGARKTVPPIEILPDDAAPARLVGALVAASLPAGEESLDT